MESKKDRCEWNPPELAAYPLLSIIDCRVFEALSFFVRFASFFSLAVLSGAFLLSRLVSFVFGIIMVVYCYK